MKGLELARKYYEEVGRPLFEEQFADVLPFLAFGLCGSGSECFGYDDALSRDHDFEPAFCVFLPDETLVDGKTAFALERAYAKLPSPFMGFDRCKLAAVGGGRHGVLRIDDFIRSKTGRSDGALTLEEWLTVPEHALAEAVNGAVFDDHFGALTAVREHLRRFPEDVRRKKLAGYLLLMGQSGQYNLPRCIERGDTAAARLCLYEFVQATLHVLFLLSHAYLPYYKWQFRALSELPRFCALAAPLEALLTENLSFAAASAERLCAAVCDALRADGLSRLTDNETERHAYVLNDTVRDHALRNAHILAGV